MNYLTFMFIKDILRVCLRVCLGVPVYSTSPNILYRIQIERDTKCLIYRALKKYNIHIQRIDRHQHYNSNALYPIYFIHDCAP